MSIEKALFEYLSNKAAIVARVSDRIYPDVAPESATYPFITYELISEEHDHYMDGATGLANPTIQIDIWAAKISDRNLTSEAIRVSLDGFTGDMGNDNISVRNCFLQNKSNFQESDTEAKGKPIFRSSMDFSIWHVESVPTL